VLAFIDPADETIYLTTSFPLPLNDFPLIARFVSTGVAVKCNTKTVISGETPLCYLPWPVLTVVAENGTTRDYAVEVRQPPLDAFVANDSEANRVWVNDGSGSFSDSGEALGSSDSRAVALGDVDGDGDLDAFVANYGGQANRVWVNDGNGGFSDSGQALGYSDSRAVALGDVDGDGDLDAFVANANQANRVWVNDGSGTFTDSGQALGSSDSLGVALGDVRWQ
jgi:hypothetical protein